MKIPAYDPENLTPDQYAAFVAFAQVMTGALIAGIPPEAILAHVRYILEQGKATIAELHVAKPDPIPENRR